MDDASGSLKQSSEVQPDIVSRARSEYGQRVKVLRAVVPVLSDSN